jgi:hypothetical protein
MVTHRHGQLTNHVFGYVVSCATRESRGFSTLSSHDEVRNASANPFAMPILTTPRLRVRPLELNDLQSCCDPFGSIGWNDPTLGAEEIIARRQSWLTWTIAGYRELERLYQPPLGGRAIVSRNDDRFIGLVG